MATLVTGPKCIAPADWLTRPKICGKKDATVSAFNAGGKWGARANPPPVARPLPATPPSAQILRQISGGVHSILPGSPKISPSPPAATAAGDGAAEGAAEGAADGAAARSEEHTSELQSL